MPLNNTRAREQLAKGNLRALFIEELGWDRHVATLEVQVDGETVTLSALGQKRGMVAYQCPAPAGQRLPNYPHRRKIEQRVAKSTHEHLIVFTDAARDTQIWQWVKREPGKPAACREHTFHRSQPGDALLQKLEAIAFTLDEEDRLSLVDVTQRARAGFDVERVTKRFYDRFQKEHATFLKFIAGITEPSDREWYASVMLNRLMFVYFIQRKGFLDGNRDYLRDRLTRMRAHYGKDKFYSFYRYFLLRLFHEGLGGKARTRELEDLLGRIPYLNGGLFDVHVLENSDRYGKTIQIPDEAFEQIFDYFDQYQWHLDERPLRADNEINPDVLGYIFEKYVNQKQMGAYYTKEDITEYISKNTVLPFIFDAARSVCKVAFDNQKGPTVWDLLKDDPDRYIYPAVRHGSGQELPAEIAREVDAPTLHMQVADGPSATPHPRKGRSVSAPSTHGLPTETWREVLGRRERYESIKAKLAAGGIRDINELTTANLNLRQFAQDVVETCEGPDLLRAFWHAIERVSILDPTCGSGAFLFASLNMLEPLYEACLDRMEAFIADLARSGERHRPEKFSDFRKILDRVAAHPNRRYFIFKSIILNNLFGVDIMEEAVEICKLRLFLKLAAQVEPDPARDNIGIEPLPDIDFNIRAGNTLVGYAHLDAVKEVLASNLDFDNAAEKIAVKAADLQQAFDEFRSRQIEGDGAVPSADKRELGKRRDALDNELNRHLGGHCGANHENKEAYAKWLKSHQPFHWFVEFYGIMNDGGFDVIIGNPPYAEIPKKLSRPLLRDSFSTALDSWSRDEDLYTLVVERSLRLLKPNCGRFGMILPLSVAFSTKRPFEALRRTLSGDSGQWYFSHYDRIPSALFGNEVRTRCTIAVLSRSVISRKRGVATTSLLRWGTERRAYLFEEIHYSLLDLVIDAGIPKVGSQAQADMLSALIAANKPLKEQLLHSLAFSDLASTAPKFPQPAVYVGGTAYNWFPVWRDIPETRDERGRPSLPARTAGYLFPSDDQASMVFALLCSSLGYWWWAVASDGFNLKKWLLERFPVSLSLIPRSAQAELAQLGTQLRRELRRHYVYKDNKGKIGNYLLPACEREVAAIDEFLAKRVPLLSGSTIHDIHEFNSCFSRADAVDEFGDADGEDG
jgi:hypothetical protein